MFSLLNSVMYGIVFYFVFVCFLLFFFVVSEAHIPLSSSEILFKYEITP